MRLGERSRTGAPSEPTGHQRSVRLAWVLAIAVLIPEQLMGGLLRNLFAAFLFCVAVVHLERTGLPPTIFGVERWRAMFLLGTTALSYGATNLYFHFTSAAQVGFRDSIEILRFPIYILVLAFVASSSRWLNRGLIGQVLEWGLWIAGASAVASLMNIPVLSPLVESLLQGTKHSIGRYRIAAPFSNPNHLGFFLVFALTYLLFTPNVARRLPLTGLAVSLIALSGSRSAFLASFVVLATSAGSMVTAPRSARKYGGLALGLLALGFLGLVGEGPSDLWANSRYGEATTALLAGEIQELPSVAGRLNANRAAWDVFTQFPLLGTASSKTTLDSVDNQLLKWLVRLGLVGALPLGTFLLNSIRAQFLDARRRRTLSTAIALWAGLFVMLLTGAFFESFRLFVVFWVVAGTLIPIDQGTERLEPPRA